MQGRLSFCFVTNFLKICYKMNIIVFLNTQIVLSLKTFNVIVLKLLCKDRYLYEIYGSSAVYGKMFLR